MVMVTLAGSCSKKLDLDHKDLAQNEKEQIVLSPEEIISIAYEHPKELEESEIIEIAKDFPLELRPGTKSNNDRAVYAINKKMYLGKNGELTDDRIGLKGTDQISLPIYDVDISNGSSKMKAYICADERFPEVIAYVPSTLDSKFIITDHPMYAYSLGIVVNRINYYNKLKDSLRNKTVEKIKDKIGTLPEKDLFKSVKHLIKSNQSVGTKSLVIGSFPTTVINKIGPFTTTLWDQGWDFYANAYNHKMPAITCEGSALNAPAGCVTVAVAQMLALHTPNMSVPKYTDNSTLNVDWALLKQSPTVDDWGGARYDLMGSLMRSVADGLQSTSACSGSSSLTSANMTNAINYSRQFVNINNLQNFSVQTCKASLDNQKIILASGSRSTVTGTGKIGHAWLVDGYAVCRKGTVNGNNGSNEIVNKYDFYLHCNLGWGASSATGWYLVNNDWSVSFDTGSGSGDEKQHYRLDLKCAPYVAAK